MLINNPATFANLVRTSRIENGITQVELATRSGMSQRWVQRLEAGEITPSLTAMISVLGVIGYELRTDRPDPEEDLLQQVFEGVS